jgi:hypothetical protein
MNLTAITLPLKLSSHHALAVGMMLWSRALRSPFVAGHGPQFRLAIMSDACTYLVLTVSPS